MIAKCVCSQFIAFKRNYELKGEKIVFVWIPKTAGTTIFNALHESLGMQKRKSRELFLSFPQRGAVTFGHVSYLDLLALGVVSNDFHESAYKFAFVRNPYDRAISLFNYFKQHKRIDDKLTFSAFLDNVHLSCPPIGIFNVSGISQANPQANWILSAGGGGWLVDDIFKVEDLETFALSIFKKYQVKLNLDWNLNESDKVINFESIKTDLTVLRKIEFLYARDFDLFGYKKISEKTSYKS